MQRLVYKSIRKATKTCGGITYVTLEVDGAMTELGTVTNRLGSSEFSAVLLDCTTLSSGHKTKKQAGGALKKHHDSGGAVVAAVKAAIPSLPLAAPVEQKVTKPENVITVPEPTLADEVDENYVPSHGSPLGEVVEAGGDWGKCCNDDAMLLIDDQDDDPLAIPAFLRRTIPTQTEEM